MVSLAAGVMLLLIGTALEVWAGLALGWRRAADLDEQAPDPALPRLVFGGPFAFVRHPQSLGLLLVLAGAALAIRSPGLWVIAAVAGALVLAMVARNDRELARQFGEPYVRYQRVVPLLVPRLGR